MSDKETRRELLYTLLGDTPDRNRPVTCRKVVEEENEHYILEKLVLDLNGIEDVPAFFTRPKNAQGKVPCVLYNHAHGGDYQMGKDEYIAPRGGIQSPTYAVQLSKMGYSGLCIDHWAFGERRGQPEWDIFKEMLWKGQVMWGMMVYDSIKAVDYLVSRTDVDADRIATMGLSMGSTMAWWAAALDPRIKVTIDICCLTDFHELINMRGLGGHGIYYYVPSLLKHFSTSDINALIAPRAHLSLNGDYDYLTPIKGLEIIDENLKKIYAEEGTPDAWKMLRYKCGHMETADMRAEIIKFLQKWL